MYSPELITAGAGAIGALVVVIRQQSKRIDRLERRLDRLATIVQNEQRERAKMAVSFGLLRVGYEHTRSLLNTIAQMLRAGKVPDEGYIAQMESIPSADDLISENLMSPLPNTEQ